MRSLLSAAVGALLVVAGAAVVPVPASADATSCAVTPLLVNPCRPWYGASAGRYPTIGYGLRAQIEAHEQRVGRAVDVVHQYHPAGELPLNADEMTFVNRADTMLLVNWKPAVVWADAAGGNDTVNATIDSVADRFNAASPHKIFLTLFHEPENDVSVNNCTTNAAGAASGSPADYRAMWRNVHERFAARGVTNVVWVMDYMNYPPWDCLVNDLYPGNDLVDWVMFNGYGDAWHTDYRTNVQHFYAMLTASSDVTHDYLSKPWGIVEWNFQNGTEADATRYFGQAKAALDANAFPRLKAYLVFDNIGPEGNENRVSYVQGVLDQAKQDAYNAFANDPVLAAGGVALPDVIAPIARVTAPTADSVVHGSVDVRADVSDESGVVSAQLLVDGSAVGQPAAPPSAPAVFTWDSTSVPNGSHTISVSARDAAGNVGTSPTVAVQVANPDVTPPTVPSGLVATQVTSTVVDLGWQPSTDGVGVAGYNVYRDGVLVAPLLTTTADHDTGLAPATTYQYAVEAVDAAGNVSAQSSVLTVTTPALADVTAPTAPAAVSAVPTGPTRVDLGWQASTDDVGVAGYYVSRDGTGIATVTSGTTYTDTVADGGRYSYQVVAFDVAGNLSAPSTPVNVTTADVTSPSIPTGLRGTSASYSSLALTWGAASDNVGVAGYRLYRDGVLVASPAGSSVTDTGLKQGTNYTYAVRAIDAAGNLSGASANVVLTTRSDDIAPSVPSGLKGVVTQSYLVTLSWNAATDSGGAGLAGYRLYRSDNPTTPLATVTAATRTYRDTLVKAGTSYTYRVAAYDGRMNSSPQSAGVTVRTAVATEKSPPSQPVNLRVIGATTSSISLAWTASTDNKGVRGYHVYRDGKYVGDASSATFVDVGLLAGSTHTYRVVAFDSSANVSLSSATITATVLAAGPAMGPI